MRHLFAIATRLPAASPAPSRRRTYTVDYSMLAMIPSPRATSIPEPTSTTPVRSRPPVGPVRRSIDRCRMRSAWLTTAMLLGGCVPSGHLARERAATPQFDPIVFFSGDTHGRGSLKILTKHRQTVIVEGHGTVDADGAIVLVQSVHRGDHPVKNRTWHLRRVAPGRFAGTLSDAVGPVTGEVTGNALHLSFVMKGGLRAQQWLYLQPGGRVSRNRMIVTKLGMPVASLDETITRGS